MQNLLKADEDGVRSRRLLIEINCLEESRRVIYLSTHSNEMADGDILFIENKTGTWEQPIPKSIGEVVIKVVCEKFTNNPK